MYVCMYMYKNKFVSVLVQVRRTFTHICTLLCIVQSVFCWNILTFKFETYS
jgi:ABC-type antimicrobial peptide transport system permease subunit